MKLYQIRLARFIFAGYPGTSRKSENMKYAARIILTLSLLIGVLVGLWNVSFHRTAHAASPIKHIVFIMKENHTFDSLFGSFPGVNGATTGVVKVNGVDHVISLHPGQNLPPPFCHEWKCSKTA